MIGKAVANGVAMALLIGCTPLGGEAVSLVTLPATKKTMPDHVASLLTGRDCSVIHYEKDGDYCPPMPTPPPPPSAKVYCTHTLAAVTCYQNPNPYAGGEHRVGSIPPGPMPFLGPNK